MNSSKNNDKNIEQLMELIPDYITGNISENDKLMLEKAMSESTELMELYNEMTGTLAFVNNVTLKEPAEQYWNSLLPRIHQRIDKNQSKRFSWTNIPAVWKYIVPIAAVMLIALVYYLVKPSDTQITRDKEIENIKKDTNKENIENKNNGNKDDDKLPPNINKDNNSVVKEDQKKKSDSDTRKQHKPNRYNENNDNIVKQLQVNDSDYTKPDQTNNDYTTVEDDGTSVFSNGEGAGFDLETEDALEELTDTEQDLLLKQLEKSNL